MQVLMSEPKKLTRNLADAKLGGVCSGLADYMGVDVTVVRVVTVLLVVFTFPVALIGYLAMWLIIPARPHAAPPQLPQSAPPGP